MDRERLRSRDQFPGSFDFVIIQFLLGMAVNLLVMIPPDHPCANLPEHFTGVRGAARSRSLRHRAPGPSLRNPRAGEDLGGRPDHRLRGF
jgi:hypothetical protein